MDRDGRRKGERKGGEGVTGAMIRARIWVDGRLGVGLQVLLGVPMAAYSGCSERDGGMGDTARGARGLGWREFAGTLGWLACQWRTGTVRLGVEWFAVAGHGAAELLLPGPVLWHMQGEAACRAGDPSS